MRTEVALSQAGMFESAEALIVDLLAVNPKDIDLWLNKAAISMQQDDVNGALGAIHAGKLDNDAVAFLAANVRFSYAKLVNSVANGVNGLFNSHLSDGSFLSLCV